MQTTLKSFALAATMFTASHAGAHTAPVKVGLMLPATGTSANFGTMIENGVKLYVAAQGGKLEGRDIAYAKVDDESDPSKASDNARAQSGAGRLPAPGQGQ